MKHEGDGGTPRGSWPVLQAYYRPGRLMRPSTPLSIHPLRPDLGWCDAPDDRNYNRPVRLPYPRSAETLWRDDSLYDAILVLDYNIRRRSANRGSAIFVHVAAPGLSPTAGCIALRREHLLKLLAVLPRGVAFAAGKNLRSSTPKSGRANKKTQRGRRGFR